MLEQAINEVVLNPGARRTCCRGRLAHQRIGQLEGLWIVKNRAQWPAGQRGNHIVAGVADKLLPARVEQIRDYLTHDSCPLKDSGISLSPPGFTAFELAEVNEAVAGMADPARRNQFGTDVRVARHHGPAANQIREQQFVFDSVLERHHRSPFLKTSRNLPARVDRVVRLHREKNQIVRGELARVIGGHYVLKA
jgi:hypothetical protein